MRKREARKVLDQKLQLLAGLVTGEKLSRQRLNQIVTLLSGASCAALALQQRVAADIDDWPKVDRLRDAE